MRYLKYGEEMVDLLKKNISPGQMIGYFVANLVGLTVVLIGVLFYCDSQHDNSEKDKFFSGNYMVISKKIDGVGLAPVTFSEREIYDLESQTWVRRVGRFTASTFAVKGAVSIGGKELSSYLFLEAVPDEFFDIKPEGWSFVPGDRRVPIILCKDYLTLYNFGFAIPQGLPQLSEEVIGDIPLSLRLTGDDIQPFEMEARVVGFSSRLNTIAVPQDFMDWANSHFTSLEEKQKVSRLIVETDPLSALSMNSYLERHEIEVAGDKQDAGNISRFLGVVSTVVTMNGIVICLLAMFILVLSIFLLLQKSHDKLRNLVLLGYEPLKVGRYYELMVITVNTLILVFAILSTFVARTFWEERLTEIGLGEGSVVPTFIVALGYLLIVTYFDLYIIRRHIMRIWKE